MALRTDPGRIGATRKRSCTGDYHRRLYSPHALKKVFDHVRPDRLTVLGHLHEIPLSGKRLDAFPSGHAVHVGALASAATALPPAQRNAIWAVGGGLVLTRIVLLAHWTSDVVAGLAVGAALERLLRCVTGFERR